ncbi:MAG TPA: hypothetical protein ENH29_11105 [Bacteroidetes bacterium]|nr:hypothetical protein [Bacteroidota bacterium]
MRKIRLIIASLLLLAIVVFIDCGKNDKNPAGPEGVEENYIPYNVGNTWTYQVNPVAEAPFQSTLTVLNKIKENNVEMAVVEERSTKAPEDFSLIYYETTANSLIMHKIADFNPGSSDTSVYKFSPPATWLKLPFKKDDTWQVFTYQGNPSSIPLIGSGLDLDSTYAGVEVKLTLTGKTIGEESIPAAGQEFKAFKVDFNYSIEINLSGVPVRIPGKLGSFWIVPKVGIVQIIFYDLYQKPTERRTLISYTVN